MSQADWWWLTPERRRRQSHWARNGWAGGRDPDKPDRIVLTYHERGELIGGIVGFGIDPTRWFAYVVAPGGTYDERSFGRRRDAKRWVEAYPRRVRG
jgi:hypothetical protein